MVYKPHPNSVLAESALQEEDGLLIAAECDIPALARACDLVVGLGTKVAQAALAVGTPVALLGPYALFGMGCCYEWDGNSDLEELLENGVRTGITEAQKNAYEEYAARELKYCLFQYRKFTHGRYGRSHERLSECLHSYLESSDLADDVSNPSALVFESGSSASDR